MTIDMRGKMNRRSERKVRDLRVRPSCSRTPEKKERVDILTQPRSYFVSGFSRNSGVFSWDGITERRRLAAAIASLQCIYIDSQHAFKRGACCLFKEGREALDGIVSRRENHVMRKRIENPEVACSFTKQCHQRQRSNSLNATTGTTVRCL